MENEFKDLIPKNWIIRKDTLITCIKANKTTVPELAPNPCWIDIINLYNILSQEGGAGVPYKDATDFELFLGNASRELWVNVYEFLHLAEKYEKQYTVLYHDYDEDENEIILVRGSETVYNTIGLIGIAEMLAEEIKYASNDENYTSLHISGVEI
jgi:hypothetical protein